MAKDSYSEFFWFAGGSAILLGLVATFLPTLRLSPFGSINIYAEWPLALAFFGCLVGLVFGRRFSSQTTRQILLASCSLLVIGMVSLGIIAWQLL